MRYLCLVLMVLTFLSEDVQAQLPIYNSDFKLCSKRIRTKGELADSLRLMGVVDRSYDIQGARVIEYYEMSTTKFVGFAGDTSLFDLRKLPYLNRTAMMKRLVKKFGPETAHDIRQGAFVPGMVLKDVVDLHGWPKRRTRKDGLRVWEYEEFELKFDKKELVDVKKAQQGS